MKTNGSKLTKKGRITKRNAELVKREKGQWKCSFKLLPGVCQGFVYFIIHRATGMYYVGKRGFHTKSRKPSEHWKTYPSSSKKLSRLIRDHHEQYDFIIIEQYRTKSGLNYGEVYTQVGLETPSDKMSYNYKIDSLNYKSKEKITDRHKRKLRELRDRIDRYGGQISRGKTSVPRH